MRHDNRSNNQLREIKLTKNFAKNADGSCLVEFGNTKVLCTASLEERIPPWLRNTGKGWVTAEYGMLPRSTHSRMAREAKKGQSGRTQEIQRLIGRALRAIIDLELLGERQITIDCDVIQADGGTRTASITGGYVALKECIKDIMATHGLKRNPLTDSVSAISCGILKNEAILDLDYEEDSAAQVDANFVITGKGQLVEVQCTGEENTFTDKQLIELLQLAKQGCAILKDLQ